MKRETMRAEPRRFGNTPRVADAASAADRAISMHRPTSPRPCSIVSLICMILLALTATATAGTTVTPVPADSPAPASLMNRYAAALALYDKACELQKNGDPDARLLFAHAAALFDALAEPASTDAAASVTPGLTPPNSANGQDRTPLIPPTPHAPALTSDPRVLHAAAYSYLFANDPGRAVLYFRRATFADPLDASLRIGFDRARTLAGLDASKDIETAGSKWPARVEQVASYLELIPRGVRSWTLIAAWSLAWIGFAWRAMGFAASPPRWAPLSLLSIAILAGASLAPVEYLRLASRDAIIVTPATVRSEPREAPDTALRREPLKAGANVSIVRRTGEWTCITLDGSSEPAWVRSAEVRRVFGER